MKNNEIPPQEKVNKLREREKAGYWGMVGGGFLIFWYVLLYIYPLLNGGDLDVPFISWPAFLVLIIGLLVFVFSFCEVVYYRYHRRRLSSGEPFKRSSR